MAKYFRFVKEQVRKEQYLTNGRVALVIVDESEGYRETVSIATVNIPDEPLEPDEVFIKDWSENEGVLNDLIEMGVISESISSVQTGFCVAYKCKLLI